MRKVVELDDLDFARMRLMVYSRQGYRIYINGNLVRENKGRSKTWRAQEFYLAGRYAEAARDFNQALRLRPQSEEIRRSLEIAQRAARLE